MPSHTLHVDLVSAPCRAACLHALLLGEQVLELEVQHVSLAKGEHKTDAFAELNPRRTVPTLKTPFSPHGLTESRAIMLYFAELAQMRDPSMWTFYPRPLYQRALVQSLLDWDQGTFYRAIAAAVYPFFSGSEAAHEDLVRVREVCEYLDGELLAQGPFVGGMQQPTLADISIACGLTTLELPNLAPDELPAVDAWLGRMSTLPPWGAVHESLYALATSRRQAAAAAAAADADAKPEIAVAQPAADASATAPSEPAAPLAT